MKKFMLAYEWPVEKGSYLAGNPLSPVAVAVILNAPRESAPQEIGELVRAGLEKGAAISGTFQTANIGIEKMVINLVSNPNIRYLVLAGRETGHFSGDALKALFRHGTDDRGFILKTKAPTAILRNIPAEAVERLRSQVKLIDLSGTADAETLEKAVYCCYQERETPFTAGKRKHLLRDPGPFPAEPIVFKLTDRLKGE